MERVKGIEPSQPAWKAGTLPLSYLGTLRGYVLLSQAVAHQVPSALKSLTSVFGMGTGVSSLL